jgi:hypothetical protein
MLFKPKCLCGKKPVVHTDPISTLVGSIKVHYCEECFEKKVDEQVKLAEQKNEWVKREQEESEKQRRYEHLKREVELKELEEKAKKLGII